MTASGRVPHRRNTLPGGIVGTGATRRGGRHGLAHAEPPLCRTGHTEGPGRSRPRPGDPDRHRRSAGRGTTTSRAADLRNPRSARFGAISLHKHLDVVVTPPDRQRAPPNGAQIRTPERRLERHTEWASIVPPGRADRSSSRISAIRRRQALKAAHFHNRLIVHAEDGALDARDLAPGRGDGPGRMHGTREPRPHWSNSPGSSAPGQTVSGRTRPRRPRPASRPLSAPPRASGAGPATNGAP